MDEVPSQGLLENFSRPPSDDLSQSLSVEVSPEESNLDGFNEECGVFGVFGHPEAANLAYLGMYALQHRGQESAGIVSSNGKSLISHRGMGLVADIFNNEVINRLEGTAAIGHNRYSTTGSTSLKNCQPLVVEYAGGGLALAHNGNLVNFSELRERLEANGSLFQSSSDSEVIIHLIAGSHALTLAERVVEALAQVRGAYSLVVLAQREMIAVRDPFGFRPLVLGSLNGAPIVASETCALDLVRADYIREIEPGEMVVISDEGVRSMHPFVPAPPKRCIFEYVYFSRPDSLLYGRSVYQVRKQQGRALANARSMATSSCRCPTRAMPPRLATPRNRDCRSRWAWCVATTSGGRLSNRASRFATSGSR
jgi:amidophosphoribosyltransferase